jgi:hypothetical protein
MEQKFLLRTKVSMSIPPTPQLLCERSFQLFSKSNANLSLFCILEMLLHLCAGFHVINIDGVLIPEGIR